MSEETGTEVADSEAAVTQRFRRFKDDLRRERASEGASGLLGIDRNGRIREGDALTVGGAGHRLSPRRPGSP